MATEILRPNAAGDLTEIYDQYPASGNHWDKVDEGTADEDSTYVKIYSASEVTKRDLYNLPASSGSGVINKVTVYVRARYVSTGGDTYVVIKTHGTVYNYNKGNGTNTYQTYSQELTTNPYTGSAWTWDEIDALQIGVGLHVAYTERRCTQIYAEVDYTAVTPKTSSDTGAGADTYVLLETGEAKTSSDTGAGVEGVPAPSASLSGSETGSGIEAIIARLLANFDAGYGVEASSVESGVLEELFASELGEGLDLLVARIEMPTKGGGMKLWI